MVVFGKLALVHSYHNFLRFAKLTREAKPDDYIIIKYIQMINTNMKYQVTQQSLSTVAILIHPLTVFQIGMMYWVVVGNSQR